MQDVEEDVEWVEIMGVEKNFEHFSPDTWNTCHPHCHCKHNCNDPSYIRYINFAPFKNLQCVGHHQSQLNQPKLLCVVLCSFFFFG